MRCTERAYAKINLTLDVGAKRADGYHEITSVMQRISLWDTVTVERGTGCDSLLCSVPVTEDVNDNLCMKALRVFFTETAMESGGVSITLEKHIPTQAGLGGGSADAAAYLRGMNRLYGLGMTGERLCGLAERLGADVPFCIRGGTALATGIGEKLTPIKSSLPLWMVICKPETGCSTPAMYRRIDEMGERLRQRFTAGDVVRALETGDLQGLCGSLYNVFEEAADLPEAEMIRGEMRQSGALAAMMTGTGSAVFGIYPDEQTAAAAAKALQESRWAVCCRSSEAAG